MSAYPTLLWHGIKHNLLIIDNMTSFYDIEILFTFLLIFIYTMSGALIEHYRISFIHESGLIILLSMAVSSILFSFGVHI